jgi:excisionase family DNA binding protein
MPKETTVEEKEEARVSKYYSTTEVANLFEVSNNAVRLWAKQGKIQGIQPVGRGHWKFPKEQIDDMLAIKKPQPIPEGEEMEIKLPELPPLGL